MGMYVYCSWKRNNKVERVLRLYSIYDERSYGKITKTNEENVCVVTHKFGFIN